jgi:hypothetical protein
MFHFARVDKRALVLDGTTKEDKAPDALHVYLNGKSWRIWQALLQ